MAFEFHLPDLAEGMTEAEVVGWKVKEGDRVALDQPLVEVMSDKATVEIPAPRAGTLKRINFREGQVCKVGEVLFVIEEAGSQAAASAGTPTGAPSARAPAGNGRGAREVTAVGETGAAVATSPAGAAPARAPRPVAEVVDARPEGRARVLATPATRRLARQLGVDLADVAATGRS